MSLSGKNKPQVLITTKKKKALDVSGVEETVSGTSESLQEGSVEEVVKTLRENSVELSHSASEVPVKLTAELSGQTDSQGARNIFGALLPRLGNVGDLIEFEAEVISKYNSIKQRVSSDDGEVSHYSEEMMLEQIIQWMNLKSN